LTVSDDKLTLLRTLLLENPELSMKEANIVIRDQFGTGVAPPQYSKLKRELSGIKTEVALPVEVKSLETGDFKNEVAPDLESFFDGQAAKSMQFSEARLDDAEANELSDETDISNDEQNDAQQEEDVKVEEKIPPAPTYPLRLEFTVPEAESVHLTGSFNRWKVEQFPLTKISANRWVFDGELPEGEHFYKLVLNKKVWHVDLKQDYFTDSTGISHKLVVNAS